MQARSLAEEAQRVHGAALAVDLEMQVRPGAAAGTAGEAEALALADALAGLDGDFRQVRVQSRVAARQPQITTLP